MADMPETRVRNLVDEQAAGLDVDVLAVEVKGSGSRQLVRVVIDRVGGVAIDTCQQLSKRLSARLDDVDPIGGRYVLEVTSPGVDWPLTDQASFRRIEGRPVDVQRRGPAGKIEHVHGTVAQAGTHEVNIDDGAATVTVAYDEIVSAKQALPW